MWSKVYGAAMAFVLAVVVAVVFTPGPVMAASTDQATQPTTSSSVQKKTEMNTNMQGQMQENMKGKMPERMMGQMMNKEKTGGSVETKAKMSGQAKTGGPGETKVGASAEPKLGAATQPKAGMNASAEPQPGPAASQMAPERVAGGQGVVAQVDRPDNCLRIRSGPSKSDGVVGCVAKGTPLKLTGVFSKDGRWAQLDSNGWVFFSQVQTSVKPPASVASHSWKGPAGSGSHRRGGAYRPYRYGYYYHGSPYYYGWPGYHCW